MTLLDQAHARMTDAPDDAALRLRFFERLADAELFMLLEDDPKDERISPRLFPVDGETYVLVFDEPTNGLDPQGIADVRELILKIAGEGKTVILASHLLDEVQKVCTHFAVLNKGKNVYTGSVEEALSNKEMVEISAPNLDQLVQLVGRYGFIADYKLRNQKVIVHLSHGKTAHDLNSFLVSNGVVVSHLVTEKKNLEEQFLEILSQTS